MTVFLTTILASFLGQMAALWLVGSIAYRKQAEQAKEIQKIIDEDIRASEKRMREYVRMES